MDHPLLLADAGLALMLTALISMVGLALAVQKTTGKRRVGGRRTASHQARLASLQAHYGGSLEPGALRFSHGHSTVLVETLPSHTRLVIEGGLAPLGFSFRGINSKNEPPLGDPDFDGVVNVSGDRLWALALLTPQTRRLIHGANLAGFEMAHKPTPTLTMSVSGHPEFIAPHISTGLALATALSVTSDLDARLMRRLHEEPLPSMRVSLALHLPPALLEDPKHLPAWCQHPDPAVRLVLASRLDHPTLWATLPEATLIGLLEDPERDTRLRAMVALGSRGTIAAIPALEVAGDRHSQSSAANEAILGIRARVDASPGGLALATQESDGGLALSPTGTKSD